MSTAVQPASEKTQTIVFAKRNIWDWVDNALAMGALALAIIAAMLYLASAIDFYNQPFIGALLSRDLTVRYGTSFGDVNQTDSDWAAQAAEIRAGDKITGINDNFFNTDNPLAD